MAKAPSLKDVAKLAGVGLGTASRVLNNSGPVTDEKRQAVFEAMEKLNYKPNAIARSLKSKKTKTIGVMIPDISNPFYPEVIRGIEDVANKYSYSIFLLNTDRSREKEQKCLSVLQEKMVDGAILMSFSVPEEIKNHINNIPIVLISSIPKNTEFVTVRIDNEEAAYEAVNHLCKFGHKDIVMISGPLSDENAAIPRVQGYMRAMLDNGIKFSSENIVDGDFSSEWGYIAMKKILEREKIPTAVFTHSDNLAIGAIKAIMEKGLRIPEDISIVGFDGIASSEYIYPGITTIKQPRYEMGAMGMETLVKLINGVETKKLIKMDVQLVERNSCKNLLTEDK
ncbi:LacI family DNA-binding transcriptional regulator [Clostridium cellulovorans]|uniref:Transcriptional regulator, LacI family n=1 Tax=Clostridium cellulovorans (strain ATCC 35296 / DSM 3052 / OCM 3 / 743B) TaxID=573061 RepID=D9SQ91_CLOC7|nr:LacI family DNA-binding transcriptional regulator [Clostridium cellulovorans]ADL50158.1 transcriptional regulator, LacI family [Clostridium cellulovorans 743B]